MITLLLGCFDDYHTAESNVSSDEDLPPLLQVGDLVPELLTLPPRRKVFACDTLQLLLAQTADKGRREDFEGCVLSSNEIEIRSLHADHVNKAFSGQFVVSVKGVV